jgi:type I restriction enzyme R subunit
MTRNESDTRAELISPKLALDGWGTKSPKNSDSSFIRREVSITAGRILGGDTQCLCSKLI